MPTTKTRINITLSEEMEKALTLLAKRDRMPEATKAAELLKESLNLAEDEVLDAIAMERDHKNAKFISFEKMFK